MKRVLYFGIYAIFETLWFYKVVQQHLWVWWDIQCSFFSKFCA